MKKNAILKGFALLIALSAVVVTKAGVFGTIRYTREPFPTICNPGGDLPGNCGTINTGNICTVNGNTYYQFTTCVTPYYIQF